MYCPKHQIRKVCLSCYLEERNRKVGSIRTEKKSAASRKNILKIHKNRKPFKLSEADVKLLQEHHDDKRAKAMLVLLETDSPAQAARAVDVTKTTIYNWKKIVTELGPQALFSMLNRNAHRESK